ncbi:MAG: Hsp20/alpha crystallin family protein [Rhodobacteraceae bacterium]|nr:Hsp20/alpha crystallin family protein [Paracoccaceae bacterium]
MVESSHTSGLWPQLYEPFRAAGQRFSDWLAPASEASTDDKAYRIAMELPRVDEADVELSVDSGVVSVKGEKKSSREQQGETWYFCERQYGAFQRSFRVPADADEADISADLKDGVLTITVPRKPPAETAAKTVKIKKG